jgi:hypothetical protein
LEWLQDERPHGMHPDHRNAIDDELKGRRQAVLLAQNSGFEVPASSDWNADQAALALIASDWLDERGEALAAQRLRAAARALAEPP